MSLHVYTGDGKGKSTAAFGLAMRALGHGKKVAIIQFMKPEKSGEILALSKIEPGIYIKNFGRKEFVNNPTDKDREEAQNAIKEASKIFRQKYDLVILDEINVAIAFGLLDINKVITILNKRPIGTNVILTGRRAHLKMIEMADVVTEMRKIKHHFDTGQKQEIGIEY